MSYSKVTAGLFLLIVISLHSIFADPVTLPDTTKAQSVTKPTQSSTTPSTKTSIDGVETTEAESNTEAETNTEAGLDSTTTDDLDDTTLDPNVCVLKNSFWPSVDGTKFFFCLPGTDTPVQQSCNRYTFFMYTKEMSGCIPFSEIGENCINHDVVGPCTGNNLLQPQTDLNPTYFYMCIAENEDPLKLKCEEGKAFLHQDGYLGCFEWELWRKIRGCPMYG